MSLPHNTRRTPSLPSTESTLASSHQLSSSTLVHPPPRLTPPPSHSRSLSSSLGRRNTRSKKAGGFLLDPPPPPSTNADLRAPGHFEPELQRSFREPTPEVDEEYLDDSDPARIVSLALASGATRKVETSRRGQRSVSANRWLAGDFGGQTDGSERWQGVGVGVSAPLGLAPQSVGRERAVSPGRGFLVTSSGDRDKRRSVSTSYSAGRRLSPLNPSSSPPPPPGLRGPLQLPALGPAVALPYQQLQKKRGLQGQQQQLRELQRHHKFSEATLQRTLKAKQQLELSALYKRLLTIYPPTDTTTPGATRAYNPLMSIRNKRIRNRERIQLDLTSWEDPGAVEQWIEDVAVSVHESNDAGLPHPPILPPPPQPTTLPPKQKRPRLDWVISPQELLAEFFWIEEQDRLRREATQQPDRTKGKRSEHSLKSLLDPATFEPPNHSRRARSAEFTRNRDGSEDYVYSVPVSSSDESGRSSESEVDYNDDESEEEDETKRKHHRRRRKLGQIITGAKRSKKKIKKKRSDAYALDADERRKRQEMEEMEWMAEMGGRVGYIVDEEYDCPAGRTGVSLPLLGGSRSSLERVLGRRSADFAEVVVPSIAISLSPPRTKGREEGYDTDGRGRIKRKEEDWTKEEKRRVSPTKKLFERSQDALVRVREGSLDRRRESIDGLARANSKDKESKTKARVKSRVEKIRNEVSKVEDFILRRDPSSAQPSPTASTFADSSDDGGHLSRSNTISEDESRRWGGGRSSLEVPDARRPARPIRYRSTRSMSVLPSIVSPGVFKPTTDPPTDLDTDDDHRTPRALAPAASRDPSPARITPTERFRSAALSAIQRLPKPPPGAPSSTHSTPSSAPPATRRDLAHAHAILTRTGILARGIPTKAPTRTTPSHHTTTIITAAKEHLHTATSVSATVSQAEQHFVRNANFFTDHTVFLLRSQIEAIRADIDRVLAPMLAGVADGADKLNEELTVTCLLAVKGVGDEAAAMKRRRRRQGRWVRRGGYLLLEWVVLGVMWWVWLVVVVLRIARGMVRVAAGAVRWVLWI